MQHTPRWWLRRENYDMGLTMGSRLSTPLRKETERKGENLLGAMRDSGYMEYLGILTEARGAQLCFGR